MSDPIRIAIASSLVAVSLHAQVWIVAAGGGGHFTDLPAAVAAVPDGSTLRVLAGSYTPFRLPGKGLNIVGEGAVVLDRTTDSVNIGPTARTQTVLLRGLTMPVTNVSITNALGPVILDACTLVHATRGEPDITVSVSGNVQLLGCNLEAAREARGTWYPQLARVAANDSSLLLAGCRVRGWSNYWPCMGSGTVGCGQAALRLVRSRAVAIDCELSGGNGGTGTVLCLSGGGGIVTNSGHGGHGCIVTDSTLVTLGGNVAGGRGGMGYLVTCNFIYQYFVWPGNDGRPFEQSGASRVVTHADAAVGWIQGEQTTGSTIVLSLNAPPAQPLVGMLLFAARADLAPLDRVGLGSMLSSPVITVGPTPLPGNTFRFPWTVAEGTPLGQVSFLQFLVLGPSGLIASNPFPFLVTR